VTLDPGRVRQATEEILSRPAYRDLVPDPAQRLLTEVRSWVAELLFDLFGSTTAGNAGIIVAVTVVGVVVVAGAVTLLGLRRRASADLVVDEVAAATVEDALGDADAARAAGDVEQAVRHRYGALVLLLVERDVLSNLPGTTVGEVDAAVARAAPACASEVAAAGRVLADVVYGHRRPAVADDDTVGAAVRSARRAIPRRAVAL
jgi:hypothetical protein